MDNNFITDKEYIRGVIRKSTVSHDHIPEGLPSNQLFAPMDNIQVQFWQNFQANGGIKFLQMLAQDQQYNVVLNTHNNLCADLEQAQMNFVNSVSVNMPIDAVVVMSVFLVARTGSIGFTQPFSRFASMRNLGLDVIVISRMKDIVPDMETALMRNAKYTQGAAMEFITPTVLPKEKDKEIRTPQNPRYILLLQDDPQPQNA